MKVSIILAVFGAVATNAQTFPDGTPECVQKCGVNVFGILPSFVDANKVNCTAPGSAGVACACGDKNFGYAVRDCSKALCHEDKALVEQGKQWAIGQCSAAGVSITIGNPPDETPTGTAAGGAASTPITTSDVTYTVTSGSAVTTLTGQTTIWGSVVAGGTGSLGATGTPSAGGSATVPLVSTTTGGGTTLSTATGSAVVPDASSSATDGSGSASSSSSSALGAQATAAPMAGLLAAAGLVAALL